MKVVIREVLSWISINRSIAAVDATTAFVFWCVDVIWLVYRLSPRITRVLSKEKSQDLKYYFKNHSYFPKPITSIESLQFSTKSTHKPLLFVMLYCLVQILTAWSYRCTQACCHQQTKFSRANMSLCQRPYGYEIPSIWNAALWPQTVANLNMYLLLFPIALCCPSFMWIH